MDPLASKRVPIYFVAIPIYRACFPNHQVSLSLAPGRNASQSRRQQPAPADVNSSSSRLLGSMDLTSSKDTCPLVRCDVVSILLVLSTSVISRRQSLFLYSHIAVVPVLDRIGPKGSQATCGENARALLADEVRFQRPALKSRGDRTNSICRAAPLEALGL